jgi:outer membrane protein assembly factor BamB
MLVLQWKGAVVHMKQRVLPLSVIATIVCMVALGTALVTNSLGHSHAMSRSVAPRAATSSRSYGVVVGNTYYGSSNQDVYALHAKTGALIWQHPTSELAFLLTVAQGDVYFVSGGNNPYALNAYALNATTGAVVWQSQATFGTVPVALFANNGVLYVETDPDVGVFSALNASNGTLLWTYIDHSGSDDPSFVLVQGMFYFASSQTSGRSGASLCAVEASNGLQIWCHDYSIPGGVSTPVVTGSIVTVGYYSGTNYRYQIDAFAISTGSFVWQRQNVYQLGGSQGMIYAAVNGSNVVEAFNAHNGALIWQNSVGTAIATQIEDIVSNGVLYTSNTNNEVDAISTADGSVQWHYNVGGFAYTLIIVNGVAYVGIGSALYALNASNGSLLWKSSIKGILCAVSIKLGIVYLVDSVTNNPVVYALSIQTGQQLWTH